MEEAQTQYNNYLKYPLEILKIFNDFFGEEYVDMQGFSTIEEIAQNLRRPEGFILVHFPHVRITNEYDRYVDITHLYAKIKIGIDGKMIGKFLLNRSEYTKLHILNSYMHSHISHIPVDDFTQFQIPCTGSGPINRTIASLNADYNEQLWQLFCLELSKYVEVESIQGVPYHRLENLTPGGNSAYYITSYVTNKINPYNINPLKKSDIINFIIYLLSKKFLKFKYVNGSYKIAYNLTEFTILISNYFIKWYNTRYNLGKVTESLQSLVNKGFLQNVIYTNRALYRNNEVDILHNCLPYQDKFMCNFKGRPVKINIVDLSDDTELDRNSIYILNNILVNFIITKILTIVNCKYGKQSTESSKKVRFL